MHVASGFLEAMHYSWVDGPGNSPTFENGGQMNRSMPQAQLVVLRTWLSNPPSADALFQAAFATILIGAASAFAWQHADFSRFWLEASAAKVFDQQGWWKAWTTLFLHADVRHLLSNMSLFFILALFLTGYFGAWVFPLLALIVGGLTNLVALSTMPREVTLVGASGVVFWMGGAWLALYVSLELRRTLKQRLTRAAGVALLLFFPSEAFDPQISYVTHAVGFVLGVLSGVLVYFLNRKKFQSYVRYGIVMDEDQSINLANGTESTEGH